jgi:anthranilate phosphoribosyltransferase
MVFDVVEGRVRETAIDPRELGLPAARVEDLGGGDAAVSAEIVRTILAGERGPRRDVVALNAAAALVVAGAVASLADGLELATATIDAGEAARTLDRWIAVSNRSGSVEDADG